MRFFFHDHRHAAARPAQQPSRAEPLEPPSPAPAPPPAEVPEAPELTEEAILAFLDSCFEESAGHGTRSAHVDLMDRVLELTSREWRENEAGAELAWLAGYDSRRLDALHRQLVAGLIRNPFPDLIGVRASRITLSALHHCPTGAGPRMPGRPDCWT